MLKCFRTLLRRILLIRAWKMMLDISRLILSRYTRTKMTFSRKTKTKRCLRRFLELTVQTRQGRVAFYRLIKSAPSCSSTLWELRNHRVIHPGDVFIAPPGRISSKGPRARLIIARVRAGCAASTLSRQQQVVCRDKTRRLFLNFISQNRCSHIFNYNKL